MNLLWVIYLCSNFELQVLILTLLINSRGNGHNYETCYNKNGIISIKLTLTFIWKLDSIKFYDFLLKYKIYKNICVYSAP